MKNNKLCFLFKRLFRKIYSFNFQVLLFISDVDETTPAELFEILGIKRHKDIEEAISMFVGRSFVKRDKSPEPDNSPLKKLHLTAEGSEFIWQEKTRLFGLFCSFVAGAAALLSIA